MQRKDGQPYHQLTEAEREQIRKLYESGEYSQSQLARMFDTCQPLISKLVKEIQPRTGACEIEDDAVIFLRTDIRLEEEKIRQSNKRIQILEKILQRIERK